jgi:hypothetical protein
VSLGHERPSPFRRQNLHIGIRYRRIEVSETETRHDLFVYETDAAFAEQVARFLVAGIDTDESVMVVVSTAKQQLLRRALGPTADSVSFADPDEI